MRRGREIALLFQWALLLQNVESKEISQPKLPQADTREKVGLGVGSSVDPVDLRESIDAVGHLIPRIPLGAQRNTLLLNRATARFQLARLLISRNKNLRAGTEELNMLTLADEETNSVLKTGKGNQLLAQAYYLKGLIAIYLDKSARQHFERSLQLVPSLDASPWMSLAVAEDHFDAGDYGRALHFYQLNFDKMDAPTQELATYKIAWCQLTLKQYLPAEASFRKLISNSAQGTFAKDAAHDLALAVTQYKNQSEIVALADELFDKDIERKALFLTTVNASNELRNTVEINSPIVKKMLELERKPEKSLAVHLSALKSSRKSYASEKHFKAFMDLSGTLAQMSANVLERKELASIRSSVESETLHIIRAFVETFSGRMTTPESLSRAILADRLKPLFAFHEIRFPASNQHATLSKIRVDVCVEMKDDACVLDLVQKLQKDNRLRAMHPDFKREELAALDRLQLKNPAQFQSAFLEKSEQFLKAEPNSIHWTRVAKRLAELHIAAKDYAAALEKLGPIHKKEPTPENFYALQWNRFQAKKFEELLADRSISEDNSSSKLRDLRRESALQLAQAAKENKNEKNYRASIEQFLASRPEPGKAAIAKKDYLVYLLKEQDFEGFLKADKDLNIEGLSRERDGLGGLRDMVWLHFMEKGHFEKARATDLSAYRQILALLASQPEAVFTRLSGLTREQRNYALNLLALLKPELALGWLESVRKSGPLAADERAVAVLTLQIMEGSLELSPNRRNSYFLGNQFPSRPQSSSVPLPFEALIAATPLPIASMPPAEYAKKTSQAVDTTRKVRRRVLRELRGAPVKTQLRALAKAKGLELDVARVLVEAPPPAGLSAEQKIQYADGIQKLAEEFRAQAGEYERIEKSAVSNISNTEKARLANRMPQPTAKSWAWPAEWGEPELATAKEHLADKHYLSALVFLDIWRESQPKKLDAYGRARAGILLLSRDNEVIKSYVKEELKVFNLSGVVQDWEGLREK